MADFSPFFEVARKRKTAEILENTRFSAVFTLEQVKGIEPSCSAWEADVLPLNYTCI